MMKILNNSLASIIATVMLVSAPLPVAAQTSFQPQTLQEMIAYLQGVIATLEAQLRVQQGGGSNPTGSSFVGTGVAETLSPQNISRSSVYLRGQVNLNQVQTATVWFEYGRSIVNEFETPRQRFNNIRNYNYGYDLSGLRTNTTYSYRLVVEVANGQIYYGPVRSFTTGSTSSGSTASTWTNNSFGLDASYNRNATIRVNVPNRSDLTSSSWLGIYAVGASDRTYQSWSYVNNLSTVEFVAPSISGNYELRLFKDNDYTLLATSPRFTVR